MRTGISLLLRRKRNGPSKWVYSWRSINIFISIAIPWVGLLLSKKRSLDPASARVMVLEILVGSLGMKPYFLMMKGTWYEFE